MSDCLEHYEPTDIGVGDVVEVWTSGDGEDAWAQLTYDTLRLGPEGVDVVAWWRPTIERWQFTYNESVPEALRTRTVSDLVISIKQEEPREQHTES